MASTTRRNASSTGYERQIRRELHSNLFQIFPKSIDEFSNFPQDLDYGETHNWKSIVLSLLVIGFVIAGIVTAIYLLG